MKYTISNNTYFVTPKDNPKDRIEVEIGDSKDSSTVQPQVKIMRWDNEVNFSARLKDFTDYTVSTDGEKIKLINHTKEVCLYDLTEGEGGYEFEVILKEKPTTNKIEFTLQDKDVEYFYQPPLTQEEIDEGSIRPEKVVGSYAIYAKTPKINFEDGKFYRTGQIGFIYRPRIEDAEKNWVWGDLHIENGILLVTIPQEFLDKAVYPVRHAAGLTIGYTTQGGTQGYNTHSYLVASKAVSTEVGNVSSISCYKQNASTASDEAKGALYTLSGTTLSYVTGSVTNQIEEDNTSGWKTSDIAAGTVGIISATYYVSWAGANTTGNTYYNAGSAGDTQAVAVTYSSFPAASYASVEAQSRLTSIYATYTAAGGTVPATGFMTTNTKMW